MYGFTSQSAWVRFLALATLCALAGASLATAADRALIVGVGKFADSRMNLPGIDLDVSLMQEVADRLGFEHIETLSDADATLDGFTRRFEALIAGVGRDDRVLVYVSSHGTRVPDDGDDEPDDMDEALLLHDTQVRDGRLHRFLRDDDFSALLRRLPSRNVLVLIDACHSGTVHKSVYLDNASLGEFEARTKFFDYEGMPGNYGSQRDAVAVDAKGVGVEGRERSANFAFLAAAADDEQALATGKGSVFTLGLNGIIKEAAKEGRTLTLETLRGEVEDYIRNKIATELSGRRMHRPQLGGNPDVWGKPLRLVVPGQGGRIWRQLEALAGRGAPLTIRASQTGYRLGEEVVFTIDIPRAGHLNVVNVGPQDDATVLFPNKYHGDNRVTAGTLTLPTDQMPFYFPATEPAGDTLTVAFLTEKKVDMYKETVEGRDKEGALIRILAPLSAKAMRNVDVASRQDSGYAAGKVIFKVVD